MPVPIPVFVKELDDGQIEITGADAAMGQSPTSGITGTNLVHDAFLQANPQYRDARFESGGALGPQGFRVTAPRASQSALLNAFGAVVQDPALTGGWRPAMGELSGYTGPAGGPAQGWQPTTPAPVQPATAMTWAPPRWDGATWQPGGWVPVGTAPPAAAPPGGPQGYQGFVHQPSGVFLFGKDAPIDPGYGRVAFDYTPDQWARYLRYFYGNAQAVPPTAYRNTQATPTGPGSYPIVPAYVAPSQPSSGGGGGTSTRTAPFSPGRLVPTAIGAAPPPGSGFGDAGGGNAGDQGSEGDGSGGPSAGTGGHDPGDPGGVWG